MHASVLLLACTLLLGQSASALSWGRRDAALIRRRTDDRHAVLGSVVLRDGHWEAVPGHVDGKPALACIWLFRSEFILPRPTAPGSATICAVEQSSPCCAGALCTGSFIDSVHTRSGFGELHLRASPKASDTDQMFAVGYLEGWLTAERVYDHFHNMRAFFNMTTPKPMQWCGSAWKCMPPHVKGSSCVFAQREVVPSSH